MSSLSSTINWPTNCCTHTHAQTVRVGERKGAKKKKTRSKGRTCLLVTLLVLWPFCSFLSAPMQASQSLRRRRFLRCVVCYTILRLTVTSPPTPQQQIVIARQQAQERRRQHRLCRHTPIFEHCALSVAAAAPHDYFYNTLSLTRSPR